MSRVFVAKRYQDDKEQYVNVRADEMVQDDSLVKAYRNVAGERKLVAVVSIGSYDAIYLAEEGAIRFDD